MPCGVSIPSQYPIQPTLTKLKHRRKPVLDVLGFQVHSEGIEWMILCTRSPRGSESDVDYLCEDYFKFGHLDF